MIILIKWKKILIYIIFNYCCSCKEILCNDCLKKHINKNNKKEHNFIKNNQKNVFCNIHPKNENKEYCLDCKTHLCNECLTSGKHVMHLKNNLLEVKPSEKNKKILQEYIDSLETKKKNLLETKELKKNELDNKLLKDQKKIYST